MPSTERIRNFVFVVLLALLLVGCVVPPVVPPVENPIVCEGGSYSIYYSEWAFIG